MSEHSSGRTRVARSREQWESLIAQFEAAGLSKGAFCREHGVAPSSFDKALRRLRGGDALRRVEPSPFVSVSIPPIVEAPKAQWDVEVQLSAETIIRLRMG